MIEIVHNIYVVENTKKINYVREMDWKIYILCDISGYQSIGVIKIPKDEVN
jgi:hypothetical protein